MQPSRSSKLSLSYVWFVEQVDELEGLGECNRASLSDSCRKPNRSTRGQLILSSTPHFSWCVGQLDWGHQCWQVLFLLFNFFSSIYLFICFLLPYVRSILESLLWQLSLLEYYLYTICNASSGWIICYFAKKMHNILRKSLVLRGTPLITFVYEFLREVHNFKYCFYSYLEAVF